MPTEYVFIPTVTYVHTCFDVLLFHVPPPSSTCNSRYERQLTVAIKLSVKPQSQRYIYLADAGGALDYTDSPAMLSCLAEVWEILNKRITQNGKHLSRLLTQTKVGWVDIYCILLNDNRFISWETFSWFGVWRWEIDSLLFWSNCISLFQLLFYLCLYEVGVPYWDKRSMLFLSKVFEDLLAGQTTSSSADPVQFSFWKHRGALLLSMRAWMTGHPPFWSDLGVRLTLMFQLHCSHTEHVHISQGKRRQIEEEKAAEDKTGPKKKKRWTRKYCRDATQVRENG